MSINQRLINEVAVGLVFVDGPTNDLKMFSDDRLYAATDVVEGLTMLANLEPDAKVSWIYDAQHVSIDATPWPDAPWKGLPNEYYQSSIDAILWRESNQKIYMFHGDQYVRLTDSVMDSDYPRPIAGNWHGLPPAFEEGIDAAFWRKTNDKIYMFKEDQYVRLTETQVDPDYPQPIAGNWHDLPSSFEAGIDAVFMHHGTNKIYMFKGDQVARLTGTTMDSGYPKSIKDVFEGLPDYMQDGISAALFRGSNDKVYFFERQPRKTLTAYVRFSDITQTVDAGYPKYVGGLDKAQAEALWREPAQAELGVAEGEAGWKDYVVQLNQRLGTAWGIVAFITKYPVGWSAYADTPKIVMAWREDDEDFDRVFAHETGHMFGAPDEYTRSNCTCDSYHGRFFRAQNRNCRLCAGTISMDSGFPKPIAGNWEDLPANFESGIDAALWREDNRKVYFFKGADFVRLTDMTMDDGYPKSIGGSWHNLPATFQTGIDAALWRKSNNRIYMFKGSQYVRLTGTTVDSEYPKPIAGNWHGLPSDFEQGIDAVVWRESNDKIYMFQGNEYVRLTGSTMDSGYPRSIASGWKELPSSFTNGFHAALMHREQNKIFLFNADQYVRMSDGVPCLMAANSPQLCAYSPLHFGWGAFLKKIDAAVWRKENDKTYLFSGDWYVRYSDINNGIDEHYPKRIAGNWVGLPEEFESDIDAALYRDDNCKLYFFKGNKYVRLTGTTMDENYPKSIAGNWKGLPSRFQQGIDAAFLRESNGKIYMFKGNEYVRLTENQMDNGYPRSIAAGWPGLNSAYQSGIHAALMRWDNSKIYFFRGRTYVRYTDVSQGVDEGYPAWINNNWMPFPR